MRLFSRSGDVEPPEPPALGTAIADYLALSRSPLPSTAPEWFEAVEPIAWETMMRASTSRRPTRRRATDGTSESLDPDALHARRR